MANSPVVLKSELSYFFFVNSVAPEHVFNQDSLIVFAKSSQLAFVLTLYCCLYLVRMPKCSWHFFTFPVLPRVPGLDIELID